MTTKSSQKDKCSIAIVYRVGTPQAVTLAKNLVSWLKEKGCQVFTAPEQKKLPGTRVCTSAELGKVSLTVVLGGDGTYLRAIRLHAGRSIPIIGVNLGSLGFLTSIRAEDAYRAIDAALANKMKLSPRALISVQLYRKGKKKVDLLSLNDVVIERGSLSQLINIAIYRDKKFISEVKADGIIIASPTGSTAYNLAAGGPILHPAVRALVVTPIAPHSLTNRPIIMPDEGKLSFKLVGTLHKAHFVVDGQKIADITNEDEIVLHRCPNDHIMVNEPDYSYFRLLREKLRFGERA
ncbi:MAG: NAD kinase [Oligoflexia bacterium]|nr:MAG: NAD kinase [Oligoflexia bacterium]